MGTLAKKQNRPLWEPSSRPKIQTKLGVHSPADLHEQEADRSADQVTGMPRTPISARNLNTQVNGAIGTENAPAVIEQGLLSPSQPLDPTNTSVTVNIADKINTALSLGISASDDKMKYRKFTCSGTIQSLTYTVPTIDKPTFPAPKPAKP